MGRLDSSRSPVRLVSESRKCYTSPNHFMYGLRCKNFPCGFPFGSCNGFLRRAHLGANWSNGVNCGSRCANCNNFSSNRNSNNGGRGVADI